MEIEVEHHSVAGTRIAQPENATAFTIAYAGQSRSVVYDVDTDGGVTVSQLASNHQISAYSAATRTVLDEDGAAPTPINSDCLLKD